MLLSLCAVGLASPAAAGLSPWATEAAETNEITYTLSIDCVGVGLVCMALDAYSDVQVATATGAGDLDIDLVAGTLEFQQDSTQDVGSGSQPAYATVAASDLTFATIPFVGAPMTEQGVVFGLANPLILAGGPLTVGTHPISAVVDYAGIVDVVGPLDAYIPEIIVTPQAITLTGTLEIIAVAGGGVLYQIEDLTGSMMVSNPGTLLGESVTVNVTADMTLNLTGDSLPAVPALGGWAISLLVAGLGLAGAERSRAKNRSRRRP